MLHGGPHIIYTRIAYASCKILSNSTGAPRNQQPLFRNATGIFGGQLSPVFIAQVYNREPARWIAWLGPFSSICILHPSYMVTGTTQKYISSAETIPRISHHPERVFRKSCHHGLEPCPPPKGIRPSFGPSAAPLTVHLGGRWRKSLSKHRAFSCSRPSFRVSTSVEVILPFKAVCCFECRCHSRRPKV